MQDRLRLGEEAQAERPDHQSGKEIAEYRPKPDALEQRHGDDAGGQQHDHLRQVIRVRCIGQ
ncbi:hypothetical protein D3C86_1881060 [compost metagenome]